MLELTLTRAPPARLMLRCKEADRPRDCRVIFVSRRLHAGIDDFDICSHHVQHLITTVTRGDSHYDTDGRLLAARWRVADYQPAMSHAAENASSILTRISICRPPPRDAERSLFSAIRQRNYRPLTRKKPTMLHYNTPMPRIDADAANKA